MPLMIKLNRNIMKVDLCLDNGHFITVIIYIGLSGSGSIFFRSLRMNEDRLLVFIGVLSNPHTFS